MGFFGSAGPYQRIGIAKSLSSLDCGFALQRLTKVPSIESDGFSKAPVAQRIRASDYGSEGREFESLQARLKICKSLYKQKIRESFFSLDYTYAYYHIINKRIK